MEVWGTRKNKNDVLFSRGPVEDPGWRLAGWVVGCIIAVTAVIAVGALGHWTCP